MFGQSLLSGAFGSALDPGEHFNTVLYTGNGTTKSITGLNFQPDLTWVKDRDAANDNLLVDSVNGAGSAKGVVSNATYAEGTWTAGYGYISSLNSNGFTVSTGSVSAGYTNANNDDYVSWNWKGGGTAVSNGTGSTTSQVSANTAAGFSIATYTGTGSAATFGHGLTSAPEFVLIKSISNTENWFAWSKDLTAYHYELSLNSNGAEYNSAGAMFAAAPTSTLLSIGTDGWVNGSAQEYICYAWHSVAGYSKIGTYAGNSGTLAVTGLGFQPKMVIYKGTILGNWFIFDAERGAGKRLIPSTAAAESNWGTGGGLQSFDADGFTVKDDASGSYETNKSGVNYIYIAFA